MNRAILVVLAVISTSSLRANPFVDDSGNTVLRACNTYLDGIKKSTELQQLTDTFSTGYCGGLAVGVARALQYTGKICTPDTATQGQAIRVIVKYLEDHPERLHEDGPIMASEALINAWPCEVRE